MRVKRSGWFIEAALALLLLVTKAQTVTIDGKAVDADKSNVAPAAEVPSGTYLNNFESIQLTKDVLANLTDLQLSDVSLFYFDDDSNPEKQSSQCKVMPGDSLYPKDTVWNLLDILSDGALIKTVPLGSACYDVRYPVSSLLNITNLAQIQLVINFARNTNTRLVIRNTGHDFLGKNTGQGALSLWTYHLKGIEILRDYQSAGRRYKGPAFKIGAGVVVHELYEAAEREGFTAVGGECRTVGVACGYAVGGGHSPVTPIHGLASDQILSINLVTPDGQFITADDTQNQDLFWAFRGGGPATFGVVTSMMIKVHEKTVFSGMTWDTTTKDMNITDKTSGKPLKHTGDAILSSQQLKITVTVECRD
ncbi:hypothetical protein NW762_001524 [Fusarium torreyae]|uniref:FAD-binding PCMH-type domain-containing protein n=1 Tax=Fusarium torreyae TaxID=1237075 RepID=A0A9W8VNI7_9HYPO|nr:hypothetical protein NW762_001524 [Fusarium torreyae]